MRFFVLFILFIIMLLGRCRPAADPARQFIPGVYLRFSTNEFGTEYDTLIISAQNPAADEFKIVRKWKYERKITGDTTEPDYHIQTSTAIYDPGHKLLQESRTGRIYSVDVSSNCLFNGPVKYQKL